MKNNIKLTANIIAITLVSYVLWFSQNAIHQLSEPFIEMASLFEYIWYGNYSAEPDHCTTMAEEMKTLKKLLN